jgi:hypothetical protein
MNLTIAIDDEELRKARRVARQRGTSVQQLIREHVRSLLDERTGAEKGTELLALMDRQPGRSGGRKVRRQEAYEERA